MVNINKIKSLIAIHGHTKKYIAEELNISPTALKNKLDAKADFKAKELKVIADIYKLPINEFFI